VIHHANVRLQLGGQVVLLPDAGDALKVFAGTLGMLAAQLITARARMGVQIEKRLLFLFKRFNDQRTSAWLPAWKLWR